MSLFVLALLLSAFCACGPRRKGAVKIVASMPLPPKELGTRWDIIHAMQLGLAEADHQAGGFTVEFEIWDDSNPEDDILVPDLEAANAQKAAADPDVLLYLGPSTSGGCKISMPILNRAGLAQISPSATYSGLTKAGFRIGEPGIYYPTGERTFFRVCPTDDMDGPAGALWIKDLGLERVYLIELDALFGQGLTRAFSRMAQSAGLTIVGTSIVADGQTTGLEKIASEVASRQTELVYYTGFWSGAVTMLKALRAGGVKAHFMGGNSIYTQPFIDQLGAQAEGVRGTFTGASVADLGEAGRDFARRFRERFGREPGGWSIMGYEVMRIALAAIEKAGQADRAAVIEALRRIEFEGLAGRYTFDENGDTRLLLITGVYIKNGQWHSDGLKRVR